MFESILILFIISVVAGLVWKFSGTRNGIEDDGSGPIEKGESRLDKMSPVREIESKGECTQNKLNDIYSPITYNGSESPIIEKIYSADHPGEVFSVITKVIQDNEFERENIHQVNKFLDTTFEVSMVQYTHDISICYRIYVNYLKRCVFTSMEEVSFFDIYDEVRAKLFYLKSTNGNSRQYSNNIAGDDLIISLLSSYHYCTLRNQDLEDFISKVNALLHKLDIDKICLLKQVRKLAQKGLLTICINNNVNAKESCDNTLVKELMSKVEDIIEYNYILRSENTEDEKLKIILSSMEDQKFWTEENINSYLCKVSNLSIKRLTNGSLDLLNKYIDKIDLLMGTCKSNLDISIETLILFRDDLKKKLDLVKCQVPNGLIEEELWKVLERVNHKSIDFDAEINLIKYLVSNLDMLKLSLGDKHHLFHILMDVLSKDEYQELLTKCSYQQELNGLDSNEIILLDSYINLKNVFNSDRLRPNHLWDIGIFADSIKERYKGKHIFVCEIESLLDTLQQRRTLPTSNVMLELSSESHCDYDAIVKTKNTMDRMHNEAVVKLQYLILKMKQVDESIYGPVVKPQLVSDYERAIFMIDPSMAKNWTQEQCDEVLGYLNGNIIDKIDEYPIFSDCHEMLLKLQSRHRTDKLMRMVIPRW